MNKKILFVGTVASSFLIFRRALCRLLVDSGYEVHVALSEISKKQFCELEAELGAVVHKYTLHRKGVSVFDIVTAAFELNAIKRKVKPDLTLGYFLKPVLLVGMLGYFDKGAKSFGMIEGLGEVYSDTKDRVPLKRRVLRKVVSVAIFFAANRLDKLIVLNSDDKRDLTAMRIASNKISVLGGIGVDLSEFCFRESLESYIFVFVGRVMAEKGVLIFADAASIVKDRYPFARFRVCGGFDGQDLQLESKLREYEAQGVIELDGQVADIAQELRQSSVFVLPSYYREGVPRSTQEAMAVGLPIITTNNTGCRDTVVSGRNGFLVDKYCVASVAEKMEWFIKNPKAMKVMGFESRKLAEKRFDVRKVNDDLLKVMGLSS